MCSSTWGTCSPTFFSDLGVCRIISYAFFFLLTSHRWVVFCSSLNMLCQGHHQLGWWVQHCPLVGLLQMQLETAVSSTGQPLVSSQRPPLHLPSCYQNLGTYTWYTLTLEGCPYIFYLNNVRMHFQKNPKPKTRKEELKKCTAMNASGKKNERGWHCYDLQERKMLLEWRTKQSVLHA